MKPIAKRTCFLSLAVFLLALAACHTWADQVITFEGIPLGDIPGESLVVDFGDYSVTFQGTGLNIRDLPPAFPDSNVLSTHNDNELITVTITNGFAFEFVEIENLINGTYTDEVDIVTGSAFSSGNQLLDMQTNSDTFHLLMGPGIVRAEYDDFDNTGYVLDNFRFSAVATIPEPTATYVVVVAGWAMLLKRKKQLF